MNKEKFIRMFKDQINVQINYRVLYKRKDIIINEESIKVSELKNYYCPWYHANRIEIKGDFDRDILPNSNARAFRISDKELIKKNESRFWLIEEKRKETEGPKLIPIAMDRKSNKRLILDGNNYCIALYWNYLENNSKNREIHIVILEGEGLENIIKDYYILNRTN